MKQQMFIGLLLACRVLTSGVQAQLIDDFSYASNADAAKAWRAIDPAPAAEATGEGLALNLQFSKNIDRMYWDRDGSWNLAGHHSFVLELSCDQPAAIRSLAIYFRSGKGWYIWNKPLPSAGRQRLILAKSEFEQEGSPGGWNKIDKIRVSPWKAQDLNSRLVLHQLAGRVDRVFVIQAGASITDSAERSVARRTSERVSRWLSLAGLGHALVPEEDLIKAAKSASVIILPYNPSLSRSQIGALRTMTQRGGKLMVFYSSDDELAALMQVKLEPAMNTRDISRWRGIKFSKPLPGVPAAVHQQSWIIGPARPASDATRTIAYWINADGKQSNDPAILSGPHGYWFTHVLLDDDLIKKQRLLAGMVANLDPTLWKESAAHVRSEAGRIDSWRNAGETVAAITALAGDDHADGETVEAFLRRFEARHREMLQHYNHQRYRDAVVSGYEAGDLLVKAYGLAQKPVTSEFRAVWDHDGTGWYPGDWDRTARLLAESGINTIFINATWAGLSHYPSKYLPESFTFQLYGDQLEKCIAAARKHNLSVHAWVVCWGLENSRPEFTAPLKGTDRLQRDAKGGEVMWMNPAHPLNVRHHLDIIREILARYDVDGIHLDYIRYPGADSCYSSYTREKFADRTGSTITAWPADVRTGGALREAFVKWRCSTITSFVRQTRELLDAEKPGTKLSAAVWGAYPQIIDSIGQDWAEWTREGLVDFLTPMNYANDLYRFTALLDQQIKLPGARGRIYPGIGVTANESQLTGDQVVQQIVAARQRGINGFALFDLSQTLVDDTLPTLRLGVTRK